MFEGYRNRTFTTQKNHFLSIQDLTIDHGQPGICDEMYKIAMRLVVLTKRLDENDPEQLTFLPAVLIFMPGINEINTFYEMLTEYSKS